MKKSRKAIAITVIISICVTVCLGFLGFKLYNHEKWQTQQIKNLMSENEELQSQNDKLNKKISELSTIVDTKIEYNKDGYNYLAIGNSITIHPKADYWWNEIGMAATTADKDYFHIVESYLKEQHTEFTGYAYNYFEWEAQANDRSETFSLLDGYLSKDINLITLQLSENVTELSTFSEDYTNMIKHIKEECPSAKIIMIDDFWDDNKSTIKREIANENGLAFADLSEIRNKSEYQCGIGTVVYGDDGEAHIVEHDGVAIHPNDKAMQYIADKVIEAIGNN